MNLISRIHFIYGPALEIFDEVHQSNPLLNVVLHWKPWMKFISPIQSLCGPALRILDEVYQSNPVNPLEDFFSYLEYIYNYSFHSPPERSSGRV